MIHVHPIVVKAYNKLPEKRRLELEKSLVDFFEADEFSMDLAEKASKLTIMVPKEDGEEGEEKFQQHGVKVVNILQTSGSFFRLENQTYRIFQAESKP